MQMKTVELIVVEEITVIYLRLEYDTLMDIVINVVARISYIKIKDENLQREHRNVSHATYISATSDIVVHFAERQKTISPPGEHFICITSCRRHILCPLHSPRETYSTSAIKTRYEFH